MSDTEERATNHKQPAGKAAKTAKKRSTRRKGKQASTVSHRGQRRAR